MIPFNLERALAGDPVVTSDGREVTQITHFPTSYTRAICGVVDGVVRIFFEDGRFMRDVKHQLDLRMASLPKKPKEREGWINLYEVPDPMRLLGSKVHGTKDEAVKDARGYQTVKVVAAHVTWTEEE